MQMNQKEFRNETESFQKGNRQTNLEMKQK